MKLKCCSGCWYGNVRVRCMFYGLGIWCVYLENQDGVLQGVFDVELVSVVCVFGEVFVGGDWEEFVCDLVVKVCWCVLVMVIL